jgi:WhiB family transcriptional regulator, redox-sensing transcriptional regulator
VPTTIQLAALRRPAQSAAWAQTTAGAAGRERRTSCTATSSDANRGDDARRRPRVVRHSRSISALYPAAVAAHGDALPCWSVDPDLFFAESPSDIERAKALCHGCPARVPCLAGAQQRGEPWGVWGGELFDHGVIIPTKRGRGRPPKQSIAA